MKTVNDKKRLTYIEKLKAKMENISISHLNLNIFE